MKYKIKNNQIGGTIPKIITDSIDPASKLDYMNKIGPLYFNQNKNPIKDTSNNFYNFDFAYKPESVSFIIDSNLNLTPTENPEFIPKFTPTQSDLYRVIEVNDEKIPYYYGKFHKDKILFGRIKFIFQMISVVPSKSNPNINDIIIIKQEEDVIKFINGLFNISDEFQQLISINQRLENPIDKYIFIGKFYELLEMLTWKPPIITIENILDFNFNNIKDEVGTKSKAGLIQLIKLIDHVGLVEYYIKQNKSVNIYRNLLMSNELLSKEKIQYIKMLLRIDFILTKLGLIFTIDTISEPDKINLIQLIDLYNGYNSIFLNETSPDIKKQIQEIDNSSFLISKNIESMDKINSKSLDPSKIFINQTIEILRLTKILHKINNWAFSFLNEKHELDKILLLSYFDIRINSPQIKKGLYLNALPINVNQALNNLFGNGRSTTSTLNTLIDTENFFRKNSIGPDIINETPWIDLNVNISGKSSTLRFAVCVENAILQLVKFLFWDFDSKNYDINKLNLGPNIFIRKFMEEFLSQDAIQTEVIVSKFVSHTINHQNISYVKQENNPVINYELDATPQNIIRILLYYLTTNFDEMHIKNLIFENDIDTVFDELNLLLDGIGYRLDLEDGERLDEFNLKLTKIDDDDILLTINLNKGAHGQVITQNIVDIDNIKPEMNKLYFYLTNNINENNTNKDYEYGLVNFNSFVKTENIDSKYFNSNNIYWLNFIELEDYFKLCLKKISESIYKNGISTVTSNSSRINYEQLALDEHNLEPKPEPDSSSNLSNISSDSGQDRITQLQDVFKVKLLNMLLDIYSTKYKDQSQNIFNSNYKLLSKFLTLLVMNLSVDEPIYERLSDIFEKNPYVYNFKFKKLIYDLERNITNNMECNVLQSIIIDNSYSFYTFKTYCKEILKVVGMLVKIDPTKLYDYASNSERPLNLFIKCIKRDNFIETIYTPNSLADIVKALVDPENLVLYTIVNHSIEDGQIPLDELLTLPLYYILSIYLNIILIMLDQVEDIEKTHLDYARNLISIFIDPSHKILDINGIQSPLKYYMKILINYISLYKRTNNFSKVNKHKDIFLKIPIRLLQSNKNILYNKNNSSVLADLLFQFIMFKSDDFISISEYLINNKLLIDSSIEDNQPVFNITNSETKTSLLAEYVFYINSKSVDDKIFKYFYNKSKLVEKPTPLSFYLKNFNLNDILTFNPIIIGLLSRNYEEQTPLAIKDADEEISGNDDYYYYNQDQDYQDTSNELNDIYPIKLLINVITRAKKKYILNFLNSEDFYSIIQIMSKCKESLEGDTIYKSLKELYEKYEKKYPEQINQENKNRILEILK